MSSCILYICLFKSIFMLKTLFKCTVAYLYISYNTVKGLVLSHIMLFKCLLEGWWDFSSHSLPQLPELTMGRTEADLWQERPPQHLCLSSSKNQQAIFTSVKHTQHWKESREERCSPGYRFCYAWAYFVLYSNWEDWHLCLKKKSTALSARRNEHFLNIMHSTVILWFILFPEKKAQIGKQHLEGIWPLREWEEKRKKKEEAGLIDQLPTQQMFYSYTVGC